MTIWSLGWFLVTLNDVCYQVVANHKVFFYFSDFMHNIYTWMSQNIAKYFNIFLWHNFIIILYIYPWKPGTTKYMYFMVSYETGEGVLSGKVGTCMCIWEQ